MLVGNVVADFDTLKRWYFNLNTYSKEKEDIIESYRIKKDMGTVPSECCGESVQPVDDSKPNRTDSKRTNKSNRAICGGK